jgi:hypothetical protein
MSQPTVPKRIKNGAMEFAGVFYDRTRSMTFRMRWPNQDEYVRQNWKHFCDSVVATYAQMLHGAEGVELTDKDKDEVYKALLAYHELSSQGNAQDYIQLRPNTEAFEGDRTIHRMDKLN